MKSEDEKVKLDLLIPLLPGLTAVFTVVSQEAAAEAAAQVSFSLSFSVLHFACLVFIFLISKFGFISTLSFSVG